MADVLAACALVLAVAGIVIVLALARPPRCTACGVPAVSAEEHELSSTPRVISVTDRCPRCGEVVARHTVGTHAD